jgi:phenylalanyl-tRNA synthetase beta subunit
MKVSYNWLQKYFKKELPNPKDLADLLNVRALEVEEVEEKDGDSIFEIKVTPNRAPDCLSHIGIAREVAMHTGVEMIDAPFFETIQTNFETNFSVEVQKDSCVRYMAREVKEVVVAESPLELKLKLESIGQRSINTIVDITNLVMYEIGQPMHAFDRDKLTGNIIKVASPTQLQFVTLDNKDIELTSEDITIQDETDNLAIAGVKGGKKAEVDSQTKNIVLESANFFPVKVRKTSRRTNIQTDSSKRFENGLTPKLAEKALHLACFYISKYASDANTMFSNVVDVYPQPQKRKYTVGLSFNQIEKKLGVQISKEKVESILSGLGIEFSIINSREEILKHIQEVVGKPYKYASSVLFDAPDVFDCASLTAYAYSMGGIAIPRVSIDQYVFATPISKEDAQPGDLIFTNTGNTIQHGIWYESKEFLPGTKVEQGVDHVGVYLGDSKVLHANSKTGDVAVEDFNNSEYFKDIRGFGTCITEESKYLLHIPYERLDLKTEIDIIEEIGRVYGYEYITPVEIPGLTLYKDEKDKTTSVYEKIATLKSILRELGFDEVITYSFGKKGDISVVKPLAKDKAYLRTNLSVGLTDALDLNFKNKDLFATECVKIFEIGNVFTQEEEKLILALAVRGVQAKQKPHAILKDTLALLSEKIGVPLEVSITDTQEIVEIELLGVLNSMTYIHNELEILSPKMYMPFSLYPYMTRDIAVWAKNTKSKSDVEKIITDLGTGLLLRYDLFDEFSKEDRTSYAYRLVFQSFDKTLTDEEINPVMDKIYQTLQADSDFEIR